MKRSLRTEHRWFGNSRAAVLLADLRRCGLMLMDRVYPDHGTYGPTRREIDVAIHDLVAANQAVVKRGPGWTRVECVCHALRDLRRCRTASPFRRREEGQ